jgi:hypothetical protein
LSKKQIEDSPLLESDKPVSRQYEEEYHRHFALPIYGGGTYAVGVYPYLQYDEVELRPENDPPVTIKKWDHNLRSTHDIEGRDVQATDGNIGHVEDFIIDDHSWKILNLIINTKNWWPGKKVLISPNNIDRISWSEGKIFTFMSREAVKNSAEYTGITQFSKASGI